MKILISSHPAHGHLYPMLPFARAAMLAGHEVVVATGPDLAPRIAQRGFRIWAVGPTFAEAWAERNAAMPDLDSVPPERHMELDIAVLFGATSAKRAVELVPMVQEWAPDLVVHEPSEFAAPLAARVPGMLRTGSASPHRRRSGPCSSRRWSMSTRRGTSPAWPPMSSTARTWTSAHRA